MRGYPSYCTIAAICGSGLLPTGSTAMRSTATSVDHIRTRSRHRARSTHMHKITTNIMGLGECEITQSYQRNFFSVNWNKTPSGWFDGWARFEAHGLAPWSYTARDHVNLEIVPKTLDQSQIDAIVTAILAEPEFRAGLESWRKDALKRLEKSIPRLERELSEAKLKAGRLKGVSYI
jgi:hypothetical protein